jgi:hypothetical protein
VEAKMSNGENFWMRLADRATGGLLEDINSARKLAGLLTSTETTNQAIEEQWKGMVEDVVNEWARFKESWGGSPPTLSQIQKLLSSGKPVHAVSDVRMKHFLHNALINALGPEFKESGLAPRLIEKLEHLVHREIELLDQMRSIPSGESHATRGSEEEHYLTNLEEQGLVFYAGGTRPAANMVFKIGGLGQRLLELIQEPTNQPEPDTED